MSQPPPRPKLEATLEELRRGFGVGSNAELLHLLVALGRIVLEESARDERGRRILRIVGKGGAQRQIVVSD